MNICLVHGRHQHGEMACPECFDELVIAAAAAWHLCQSLLACPGAPPPQLTGTVAERLESTLINVGRENAIR